MLEEEVFGMYHQTHCCFYNDFAYDSHFEGAAKHCTEGERLAKLIGDKAVLFMANHGVLFTAPTVRRIQNMDPGPRTTPVDPVHGPLDGPPLIFINFFFLSEVFCQYKGWAVDWGQGNKNTVLSLHQY